MSTHIEVAITIDREPSEVFAFISDFSNNPKWQSGMQSASWTSEPPTRVGSTYTQTASFLGREIVSTFEVTELEPGRRVAARSTSGPFPIRFTRMVEPVPGGSQVRAIIEGDASGFFRLAGPVLNWLTGRSIRSDYRQLKDLLEGEEAT